MSVASRHALSRLVVSASLPLVLLSGADLPDGPGKAEINKLCVRCHPVAVATSLRQGQDRWVETLSKMANLGAQGSQEEYATILKYLVQHFGPRDGEKAADPTAPAGVLAPRATAVSVNPYASAPSTMASKLPKVASPEEVAGVTKGAVPRDPASEWWTYGHDPGAMRFSPLKAIRPENVRRLKVAWVYHMRPEGFADSSGAGRVPRVMEGRGPAGRPVGDEPEPAQPAANRGGSVRFGSGYRPSSATPLVVRGIMYLATPYSRVAALDPTSGKELWSYHLPSGNPSTRGVEYWPGEGETPAQVVFGSTDGKLYSLDAKTGKPNPAFGDNGIVNLNTPAIMRGLPGRNAMTSPPIVYKNLVITGGTTQENPPLGPAGDVRAWDMRTGKLVWTFHSVPQAGEKGHDSWAGESWKNRSGANVWTFLTVDQQRGIVYMPFGAPSVDQYGGDRVGDNLFSSSLVAADANTGKYLWHFQLTHHDIWDADMPGAPALIDVKQGGKTIPAVVATNKVGLVFLLDRVTGKPIYGVEERPVPASEVPLERASKTQPFPLKPPPLARVTFSKEEVAKVTPELESACRKLLEGMATGGPYLPQTYNRLRVAFPGNHGGINWGGTTFDPQLGYLFANVNELGQVAGLRDHDPKTGPAMASGQGNRVHPDGPYQSVPGGGRFSVRGPGVQQLPCQEPPWGQLVAVDVNTGNIAWRVPLGITEGFPEGKQNTGRPGNGGAIATAGGLVFVAATDDARFRAFESRTGKELWTFRLNGAAQATPITYEARDRKQYVALAATGGGFFGNPVTDDAIVAFALDESAK